MMKDKETLVILTPAFPRIVSDSAWVTSQQILVSELKHQFPELNIIVLSFLYPYEKGEYDWHKIKVIAFDGMKYRKIRRIILWLNIWKKLKEIKKGNDPICILSFWCGECALIGSWFAKLNKLKHYCWICGQDARKTNKYVRWVRPRSSELIAMSDFLAIEFSKNHRIVPDHIITNAIDPKMFSQTDFEREIDIIGVGSFSYQKNYNQYVSIIGFLKKKFPSLKAVHCGDGEDSETIKSLMKKFDLGKTLSLLGIVQHPEVIRLMQRSKILLHPSIYEGFSTVCLEALYAGAHVISFTKPMNHEITNWHIVKTKEEMIAKAEELLVKKDLEHDKVMVYSIEDSAKKIMALFD